MKTVLSTKTLDSDALAYARTQNLELKCLDFIETDLLPFDIESIDHAGFDAIAFTSPNAAKYFFESNKAIALIKGKQVFSLPGKTKDNLSARGFAPDITATSASELAGAIIDAKSTKGVLHVCGNQKLPVLQEKLEGADIAYYELPVYQTVLKSNQKVNEPFNAILFFSPSGVESFLTENNFVEETVCCCIGATTAQALKERKKNANIILPDEPTPLAMLKAVATYISNN